MTLTPEQIAELQAKAAEADDLRQRLAVVDGKKTEILDQKKQLQQQLRELTEKESERQKKDLEAQGKTAELLEQERKEKQDLLDRLEQTSKQIEEERQQRVKDRVRADFLAVFSASEVFQPDHVWAMLHSLVQDKEGETVASHNGQQVTLAEFAGKLRQDASYAYLFKPKGNGGGMGSRPAAGDPIGTSANPYLPGGSLTRRLTLELDNPDLAAKLKAEAATAASKG